MLLLVTLDSPADSLEAEQSVQQMRADLDQVSTEALVGGTTAVAFDTQQASKRDNRVVIPLVLVVIFLVLILLLRSIVAPLLLIGTVVLSFFAALGLSAFFFNNVFDFPGADSSFPLFTFVFLVALGIDYNIFLMTRVQEESKLSGTRPGILRGLTVTGGRHHVRGHRLGGDLPGARRPPAGVPAGDRVRGRRRRADRHVHRALVARSSGAATTSGDRSGGRDGCRAPSSRRTREPAEVTG